MGSPRVALVTLGCARNEVDSEELAGRLVAGGFALVDSAESADAVLVNTCGFIDAAKRESLEVLMSAADPGADGRRRAVVAVGCMAERYGAQLAAELPEADAVLGFDAYADIAERIQDVIAGRQVASHVPRDRRALLPLAPVDRPVGPERERGTAGGPAWIRRRISGGPVAPLRIASGCDRRCAFCAIPSFRGRSLSRPVGEVVAEARWLVGQGVREVVLVSENSTSYGKDLTDPRALEGLLAELAEVPGLARIRVSYLQPAEVRPSLVAAMVADPVVADHFDLSFQHASVGVLRRMRRFGGTEHFLDLIAAIRVQSPQAGIRSNVLVGFPGETPSDVDELLDFLGRAQMDAVGVFGYSDEEGTEAAGLSGHLAEDEIRSRVDEVAGVVDEVMAQRAERRVGDAVQVLVETRRGGVVEGRAAHQGPEDGSTAVRLLDPLGADVRPGTMVTARVVSSEGVDLHAAEVARVRA